MPIKHLVKHDLVPAYEQMHSMLSFIQGDLQETEVTADKQKRILQFLKALVQSTQGFEKSLVGVIKESLSDAKESGLIGDQSKSDEGLQDDVKVLKEFLNSRSV